MKNNEVSERVRNALTRLETEQDVRVLYACESGSRAWGFASQDSDYDVRFLYVHRREWYLSIESRRDVIEEPLCDELDVSGWELRKALRLLRKSNPPLLEWMKSPMVYHRDVLFAAALLCALPAHGIRQLEELSGRQGSGEPEKVSLRPPAAAGVPLDRAFAGSGAHALSGAGGRRAR
jgi:hypothetical protein